MNWTCPLAVAACFVPTAVAQTTFLTPNGFALPEGSVETPSYAPTFYPNARVQYFDGTQVGTPRPHLNKLELRRHPSTLSGFYPGRSFDLVVILAHTSLAARVPTFANNYKGGLATTVFTGTVNWPDFSVGPLPMPAPWSIAVPLYITFSYNGVDDLLVEFQCSNQGGIGMEYPVDCIDAKQRLGGYVADSLFDYCMVGSLGFSSWVAQTPVLQGGTVTWSLYASDGPTNQAGALVLGVSQWGSDLGGSLCAALQPNLDLVIPVVTDALGAVASPANPMVLAYGWPGFVHKVFTQFVALDPMQTSPIRVALSDHVKWTVGTTGPYAVASYLATARYAPPTNLLSGAVNPDIPVMRWTY